MHSPGHSIKTKVYGKSEKEIREKGYEAAFP